MVAKNKVKFTCEKCEYDSINWIGKCPSCLTWNSFQEKSSTKIDKAKYISLSQIKMNQRKRLVLDHGDFDSLMGGGLVEGSLTLISGEPGVGKSTLLLKLIEGYSKLNSSRKVLYVSGEESLNQISERATRLKISSQNIFLLNESSWQEILVAVKNLDPELIILDSIQTIRDEDMAATPGSVGQVRNVTQELLDNIKGKEKTAIIIGHITKDGAIAGPKVLEHMVDSVVTFKKEKDELRSLKVKKNRFGPTGLSILYKMSKSGIRSLKPSEECVNLDEIKVGSCLTYSRDSEKLFLKESQALINENKFGQGKRVVQGLEVQRINLLIATIEKYIKIPLSNYDVFFNVASGQRFGERWSDLSIVASILSSYYEIKPPRKSVFFGEVGLCGDISSCSIEESDLEKMLGWGIQRVYGNVMVSTFSGVEFYSYKNLLDFKDVFINKAS